MKECMEKIPENIKIYLQEIADRMKQGRAVVMVGSGFSKNAVKCRYTHKKFLDWSELGDIFYKKLYGKKPQEEEKPNYYQDVLKLASKVEQCLGRTTLDRLLLDHLPDEEYEPSKLHEMLLKLNWTDIFTTNYDTLLERTRVKVFDRRYQVVLNKDDLVYSKCPRIIKLHGSFPSTRPFVLTEEDYRRYPKDSAVFVNTVQQALIENVMCMVGFSGDDPNFLNWIGWIRDNLGGSAASKIYLIGVFDVKETELKLCESRNIVLVNMKDCAGIEAGQHKEGLELFFRALSELQDAGRITENYLDKEEEICGCIDEVIRNVQREDKMLIKTEMSDTEVQKLGKITGLLRKRRDCYPGWTIMPYRWREEIENSVYHGNSLLGVLHRDKKLMPLIGDFLYEFDWRREHCMLPLEPEAEEWYQFYLLEKSQGLEEEEKHKRTLSMRDMKLYLALLGFYRERGEFEKWAEWEKRLSQYWLDEEQEIWRYCERAYQLFFDFEYSELSEKLVEWPDEVRNGETILLHAALLCELGYFEKAVWLLKLNLDAVRGQIGEDADYQNYSREAYIIVLLESIEKYFRFIAFRDEPKRETESYTHLRALWSYDCNPEYEEDYLVNRVILKKEGSGSGVLDELDRKDGSAQLLKFMQQTGRIFRNSYLFRHDKEYVAAVRGIARTNPYLALVCTLRYDDSMACSQIWGKEMLADLKEEQADQIVRVCMLACKKNKGYILETLGKKTGDRGVAEDRRSTKAKIKIKSIITTLPRLCPSIIAGIVPRASTEVKMETVEFIAFALKNPGLEFGHLDRMVKAIANSLGREELRQCLTKFMEMPLEQELEPFYYLDLRRAHGCGKVNIQIGDILKSDMEGTVTDSVRIRKLAYSIITGEAWAGENVADDMEKVLEKNEELRKRPMVRAYYYYRLTFGGKEELETGKGTPGNAVNEYRERAKKSWLSYFQKQIERFSDLGRDYCLMFRNEMEEMLAELKFYHYNGGGNYVKWNVEDTEEVVRQLVIWAEYVKACCGCKFGNGFDYVEGWYTLWEILLEVLFHGEVREGGEWNTVLKELGCRLAQIDIPLVIDEMFLDDMPEFTEEIYDWLVPKLFDGKKSFIVIGKLVGTYVIAGKGNRSLLKRFWNLILRIGEKHTLEMTYLQQLKDEIEDGNM